MLVSLFKSDDDMRSFEELEKLAFSAGAEVIGKIIQKKEPRNSTLFGKGKLTEMLEFIEENDIGTVICDNELSGVQLRNISETLNVKVLDRSALILDIFAQRAVSYEGKLQVELAQLKYNLPRLIGSEGLMGKYGGGIGMRGPGEKKLETDRRKIRKEVDDLTKKIAQLSVRRDLMRKQRIKTGQKTVSLVGYTNAGKSSIMNLLSKSGDNPEDKLFATLDPTTRKVFVDEKQNYLLTDTVGFIEKLPHEFIDAFASTLEEAKQSTLLLHIIDASNPDIMFHYDTVLKVLERLEISVDKMITVYNKADLAGKEFLKPVNNGSITVSAKTGEGIEQLKELIIKNIGLNRPEMIEN